MKIKYRSDSKILFARPAFFVLAFFLYAVNALAGSLWREAVTEERGMFADKRARRVGDIITVVLFNERVKMDVVNMATRSDTNTSKPGLGTNLLNQFLAGVTSRNRIPTTDAASAGAYQSTFPSNLIPREGQLGAPGGAPPILNPGSTGFGNKNDNTVMFDRNLNSQIAVQVIDMLPNGNLVIEGQRMISFGPERMFASLRGIVRPYDVTAQNTIPSSLVADVRIDFTPEGPLSFTAKPGWLQRIDEKISPW